VRTPKPLVPILTVRPFRVDDALARGVPRNRLYASDLQRPFHGVRSVTAPGSFVERMRAYLPRMADGQFFSHATAALHYGVPLPLRLERDTRLHVSVIAPTVAPAAAGVVGHRLLTSGVVSWRGFVLADPAATWCQLAGMLSLQDLVAAGDYLLTGPDPLHGIPALVARGDLERAVRAHGNRRGIRSARQALELVRCGPRSKPETLVRLLIVMSGLPEPQLNPSVRMLDGSDKQPDLAYPKIKFGIEYEGEGHREDSALFLRDIERKEAFADIGWELMRVTRAHLQRPSELTARILRRVRKRCQAFAVKTPI